MGTSSATPGASFAAIDFETANNDADSACAIGVAIVTDGELVSVEQHLIRPPSEEFVFTYIHGLTWEDVRDQPEFPEVWEKIAPKVTAADALVAHNAPFDRRVLQACCRRYGVQDPAIPFVCTVQMARSVWGIYPTKLPDVCRHLGISLNHHDAGSDSEACGRIVVAGLAAGWRLESADGAGSV